MKDVVNVTPLPTVNTTGYIAHAVFLGMINTDTNKIPYDFFQSYLNIYDNYIKALCMPDRTEASRSELNQDYAHYGFRSCHLKNSWTARCPRDARLSGFFFQAKDGIRDLTVTGVQTCALPI